MMNEYIIDEDIANKICIVLVNYGENRLANKLCSRLAPSSAPLAKENLTVGMIYAFEAGQEDSKIDAATIRNQTLDAYAKWDNTRWTTQRVKEYKESLRTTEAQK